MADLPRIKNPEPVSIPQKPAEEYPDAYIVGLDLKTLDTQGYVQSFTVDFKPYNYDLKVIKEDGMVQSARISNIWIEAGRSNLFANAMGLLAFVCNLILQRDSFQSKIDGVEVVNKKISYLQGQASAVISQLNILRAEGADTAIILGNELILADYQSQIASLSSQVQSVDAWVVERDKYQSALSAATVNDAVAILGS